MDKVVGTTKAERKLQERINRIKNLTPGKARIWNLDRLAMELDLYADWLEETGEHDSDPDGLRQDATFLRRLQHDLAQLREAVRGDPRKDAIRAKYDPANWPQQRP